MSLKPKTKKQKTNLKKANKQTTKDKTKTNDHVTLSNVL